MNLVLALTIGGLYSAGAYLLLSRSMIRILFGIVLLGNATNLTVFTCARIIRGAAPLIKEDQKVLAPPFADPLGQALILTAIVISFGVLAFAMVLIKRGYDAYGIDDTDALVEDFDNPEADCIDAPEEEEE